MISLVLKDILVQKRQILFSLLYIIFVIVAFQAMGPAMFPAGIIAFTYMLIITSCAYEDKNSSYVILSSLPIKRSRIVLSKYMTAVVFLSMGILSYAIVSYAIIIARIPLKVYPITVEYFLGAFVAFSLLNSIYFPIFFKFGYMKSKFVNFILFFAFFFGINIIADFLNKNREQEWLNMLLNLFENQSDGTISAILILIATAALVLSYALSVKFFNNREL